jgi:hypothetical protein
MDWYGPNNSKDQAAQMVMAEAEKHPGFSFAIAIDKGAFSSCSGCSPQQALVSLLQYIEHTYFPSRAYMTVQGKPVVTNFDIDLHYTVDWNAANAALSIHPAFWFQNYSGFSHVLSDGSYAWVMPTQTDYGMSYLSGFYATGIGFPGEQTIGATYKGFNDTLAAWTLNRIMGQQCGQTWLQTFAEINGPYNSGKQLTDLQLVTWNDYEEGTEIESGIDNCFSLAPSLTGNALQWKISGNESTVDHYTVYISNDGQNLMSLTDLSAGLRSLNLCGFPIPNSNYKLFVQAVGKPTMANQIAGPLNYNSTCGGKNSGPTLSFSAAPSSVTIAPGASSGLTVSAQAQSGAFNSAISLSCAGIPASLTCSFSPAAITPGSGTATSKLTISAAPVTGVNLHPRNNSLPIYAGLLLPFGIGGIFLMGSAPRRRKTQMLALIAVVGLGLAGVSCGGRTAAVQRSTTPVAGNYSITVQGSSSSSQLSTVVTVIIQ